MVFGVDDLTEPDYGECVMQVEHESKTYVHEYPMGEDGFYDLDEWWLRIRP